jgi:Protein of unknown function (DUF4012)
MPVGRHNRLRGQQPLVVAIIAGVAGLSATFAGLHPTGSTVIDVMLVAAAAAAVTWAAATAPWWTVLSACGIAAALADGVLWMAVGLLGALIVFFVGLNERSMPWGRSVAALAATQVFAHSRETSVFGVSALVALVALSVVFVLGVQRRSRSVRKRVVLWSGGALAAGVLAMAGMAIAGLAARAPLEEGNRQARAGLSALNAGDIPAAAAAFESAADAFAKADGDLSAPWAQPSRLLPMLAQNRDALTGLANHGATSLRLAAGALAGIDTSTLRVVNGQIDLDAVRALVQPFTDLRTAIDNLGSTIADVRSPWLVAPLQDRLVTLGDDVAKNAARADNALLAASIAPDMLGGNGVRHYFVAFASPSEARGLGGFMGNWAELTIDNGHITMSNFGRAADLSSGGADPGGRKITGPAEFIEHWGRFGFVDPVDGTTGVVPFSNVTMPPDFPSVAQVIAELYPQSGGRQVDGVFYLDPEAMAKLVGITGPLAVDGVAEPITAANFVEFINKEQYLITAKDQRVELLDGIAHAVVAKLFATTLPPPAELARLFGPLARQDRLMGWSAIAAEEDLFQRVGMGGVFPQLNGADGVAVTVDNASASKIDTYLAMDVKYDAVRGSGGNTTGTATITLTNNAPASGLPAYVIGNVLNLPEGTNHMFLTVYTALAVTGATLDGETIGLEFSKTLGWESAATFLDIAPAQSRVLTVNVQGTLPPGPYRFVTRVQPFAVNQTMTNTVG